MYLRRLYIKGFRSIRELDLAFRPGKNVIIGRNNSGKSNIIRALDVVLGESAPAYTKSDNITENDFYSYRVVGKDGAVIEQTDDSIFIWCELERRAGEELDWPEINKCFGFNFYGKRPHYKAEGVPTRIPIKSLKDDYKAIFEINDEEIQDKVWVDSKLKNQNTFQQQLSNKYHFAYAFLAQKTEKGVAKQLRFLYREGKHEDWVLAFRANVRTELLQSAILPAFRDPALQLRLSPWTWFGKMMKHLTKDCGGNTELKEAFARLGAIGNRLFEQVTAKIENDALSVSFPNTKLSFQFNIDTRADIYKSCVVYLDDGFKSLLTDKGAGIQSATLIGLFSYYTRQVNTTGSALLCVEEPELYLHPHARRVVSDRLDEFLDNDRNQVIITTHGVEFLRTVNQTLNILLVRKSSESGTTAQDLDAREFLDLLINNNQNELFFSDKVILCEGLDEYILRAAADELFPSELDRQNVSIISLGGKDRLVKMSRVILKLRIDCFIQADFDFLLRDTTKVDEYDTKAHPSIEHLPNEFFAQAHVAGSSASQYKKDITDLRNKLRLVNPKAFYQAKRVLEFEDAQLPTYLKKLRKCGIGILDGQIEDLSKDTTWLNPITKKLNLEHIYELRKRLNTGAKVSDLFELEPLKEFLEPIIGKKQTASSKAT